MAGGLSLLLGLFGLGAAAGIRTAQDAKPDSLRDYHTGLFSYQPTAEEKRVYNKWHLKNYNPKRDEWIHKVPGYEKDYYGSKIQWWEHVYEDEGVPVNRKYLLIISGMAHQMFMSRTI